MARVVAPLVGTVTTGTWVTNQRLTVAAMPHGFINYSYLLPQGYDPVGTTTYPVLVMGHTNTTGSSGSTYPNSPIESFDLGSGATIDGAFNNVTWRRRYPSIVIIPYCDQTDGTGGTGQNFGGYADSPDSGGNEKGVMALVASVLANFKADPTRVYATGWSLGGIGSTAWMLDNNALNGSGSRLFAAGLPISGRIIRTPSPPLEPMRSVPMMCVSGSQDTTSPPSDFNRPTWSFFAGNQTYPNQSTLSTKGVAGLKAGSSSYYYLEDTTLGHSGAYFTYGVTSAGYPLYDWLFAQTSGVVTPASMIAFFNSIAGTSTISCQFIERGNNTTLGFAAIDAIHTNTGKWLGGIGGDYFFFGQGNRVADTTVNQYAKTYWDAGGLFILSNHMSHPTSGGGVGDILNSVDAKAIVTSGNTTNTNFNAMLDTIIAGVLDLQNSGVITIYRPFHEMNGNWFWWGTQNFSAAQMIAMWRYTHDRFVAKGVTQILWDWSPNAGTAGTNRTSTDTYPGSAYVDIIGHDFYSNNPGSDPGAKSYYNTLIALASDKPFFFNEFGAGSPSAGNTAFDLSTLVNQISTNMPNTVLWQQWWGGNGGSVGWGMAENTGVKAALSLSRVLNRGDFSLASTPAFTPSPNNTVILINVPGSITDSVGSVWTIATTGGGQVVRNGVTDTTTANVKEMAYVNNVVWHENLTNQWYSLTSTGGWTGGGTVSPLPDISPSNSFILANVRPSLTDANGAVWTIVPTQGGQVAKNGVTDTTTQNVIEMAYVSGLMWHENITNDWYSLQVGGTWGPPGGTKTSPLPAIPVKGTFILAGTSLSLVDANYNTWTIAPTSGGQVVKNGVTDTTTQNVVEMAYVNGVIYHENTTNDWYALQSNGTWGPPGGSKTSPLTQIPGGLSYIRPMKQAGLRVITYIKQESPAAFVTGLASLRAEQSANHDIFAYEGCQEPDTAVLVGTPETLASAASFQPTVWNAGQADGLPVIQTSFGVLTNYGTTGNLSASATYGNAHTYPGATNSSANYAGTQAGGFIAATTNAALLTSPGKGIAHTEFGWLSTTNNPIAVASYVLNFVMSGMFDFNLPYMIVQGLYDDATNGAVGLFNNDQTPRLVATALSNLFTLLKDTAATALSFGPGKLNITITNLPASPSGSLMGGKFGVLQKSDGSFWVMVRNEQNLTTAVSAGSTPITVPVVNCSVTLGTIAASIDVFDPLAGLTAQSHFVNTSNFSFSLPAHPVLIKIVRP
jgi:mannan endo-1,4-beta-mannosidase